MKKSTDPLWVVFEDCGVQKSQSRLLLQLTTVDGPMFRGR